MNVGTFYVKNNGACVFCIGDKNIVPGADAVALTKAEADHPIVKNHIKAGKLALVEAPAAEVTIEKMTVKQLEAYAKEKGCDLAGATTKDDILAKIKEIEAGA